MAAVEASKSKAHKQRHPDVKREFESDESERGRRHLRRRRRRVYIETVKQQRERFAHVSLDFYDGYLWKRWFVVANGELEYFRSAEAGTHDAKAAEPQGKGKAKGKGKGQAVFVEAEAGVGHEKGGVAGDKMLRDGLDAGAISHRCVIMW